MREFGYYCGDVDFLIKNISGHSQTYINQSSYVKINIKLHALQNTFFHKLLFMQI